MEGSLYNVTTGLVDRYGVGPVPRATNEHLGSIISALFLLQHDLVLVTHYGSFSCVRNIQA